MEWNEITNAVRSAGSAKECAETDNAGRAESGGHAAPELGSQQRILHESR